MSEAGGSHQTEVVTHLSLHWYPLPTPTSKYWFLCSCRVSDSCQYSRPFFVTKTITYWFLHIHRGVRQLSIFPPHLFHTDSVCTIDNRAVNEPHIRGKVFYLLWLLPLTSFHINSYVTCVLISQYQSLQWEIFNIPRHMSWTSSNWLRHQQIHRADSQWTMAVLSSPTSAEYWFVWYMTFGKETGPFMK
jgi:hypothetical protein